MSDDKRVSVILRTPEGLANAKDGEVVALKQNGNGLEVAWEKEKQGKFQWK